MEEKVIQGLPKDVANVEASNLLLPVYRKGLRNLYLHYIKWYRVLRTDPVHKKVMKTLREFMEDDDMDYMEAAEAAINKRKYLLNRLFEKDDLPKDTSNEDENLTYSARKRKYYEAIHTM